ncbi:predicted protein [Chaetoceros tenuissimus]|uniref:Uncharacterized protein n=1 Tax=Chaetoceros tenuissimus TaxID=426638 RepID=A0AAD3H606_9STRA|nr:predicted protein [Chaetoceros tenuissimus]
MDHDEILQPLNTAISSISCILNQSKEVKRVFLDNIEKIEESFHKDIDVIQQEISLNSLKPRKRNKAQHCLNFHLNKNGNVGKKGSKCEQIRIGDVDENCNQNFFKSIESLLNKFSKEEMSLGLNDQSFKNEAYEEKVEDLQKRKSEEIVKLISSFQPNSLKSTSTTAPQRLGVENLLKENDERVAKRSTGRRNDDYSKRNKRDSMVENLMKHREELFTNLEDLPLSVQSEGESTSKQEFSMSSAISESK